ncbi:MAG: peptidase M16, partial [Clostridia bacterium]|nr:peptidase M16 [Clostridia bacterium]
IEQKLSVSTPIFAVGFKEKETGIGGYELLKKEIATEILIELLFGKSSENYIKMYESGIIDASFDGETELEEEYGFTSFGGESKEPKKVYEAVLDAIDRAKRADFKDEEIKRIKKAILSDDIRMYNNMENIGNTYIKSLMKGINPLDYTKAVEEIDKEYLKKRLEEHFDADNCVLSVVYPIEEGK